MRRFLLLLFVLCSFGQFTTLASIKFREAVFDVMAVTHDYQQIKDYFYKNFPHASSVERDLAVKWLQDRSQFRAPLAYIYLRMLTNKLIPAIDAQTIALEAAFYMILCNVLLRLDARCCIDEGLKSSLDTINVFNTHIRNILGSIKADITQEVIRKIIMDWYEKVDFSSTGDTAKSLAHPSWMAFCKETGAILYGGSIIFTPYDKNATIRTKDILGIAGKELPISQCFLQGAQELQTARSAEFRQFLEPYHELVVKVDPEFFTKESSSKLELIHL